MRRQLLNQEIAHQQATLTETRHLIITLSTLKDASRLFFYYDIGTIDSLIRPIASPTYLFKGLPSCAQLDCLFTGDSRSHLSYLGLRVAALFIILVSSTLGALLPVLLARRAQADSDKVPRAWLNFAKHFGSGIILGTAFIHLLAPGIEALGNPCLPPRWRKYPYALGLCLSSILGIFVIEILTVKYGARWRTKIDDRIDTPNLNLYMVEPAAGAGSAEEVSGQNAPSHTHASLMGLAILEFGAILHSVLIGLTLAVDVKFKVLFAVLVTHQVFEGLGIGSRLASIHVPARYTRLPIIGAVVFGLSTPVGMAIGLAMHATYKADDPGALVISGVLDSLSAGILMYTALVELLGRDVLFNQELMGGPVKHLVAAVLWVLLGCCVMGLLGKWV
ncbi:Zinc-regulated transporter 1 [Mycena venus]|uniref:Zinc-regulated transporter 1 n=1 Tax=Mycena venus TaxID=2733690 RepID=A0A8H7DE80_9AGAR|nr:Zinc-regulated transporter 1 [Mycena venus]